MIDRIGHKSDIVYEKTSDLALLLRWKRFIGLDLLCEFCVTHYFVRLFTGKGVDVGPFEEDHRSSSGRCAVLCIVSGLEVNCSGYRSVRNCE